MESLRIRSTALHSAQVGYLQEMVRDFHIRGTVFPKLPVTGQRQMRALGVELTGSHVDGVRTAAGCEECRRLFSALLVVAIYLLPKDIPSSAYQFEFCDEYLRPLPVTVDCPNGRLVLELAADEVSFDSAIERLFEMGLLEPKVKGFREDSGHESAGEVDGGMDCPDVVPGSSTDRLASR